MNPDAVVVLFPALIGLVPICRGGSWHWDPIGMGGPACLQTRFFAWAMGWDVLAWLEHLAHIWGFRAHRND